MRKSAILVVLAPAIIGLAVMIGIFVGRVTAGDTIQIEKHEFPSLNTGEATNQDGIIDINTASAEELSLLPGIGEVLAQRIVEYRERYGQFKDVKDLLKVTGIGETKLNGIIDYIKIGE